MKLNFVVEEINQVVEEINQVVEEINQNSLYNETFPVIILKLRLATQTLTPEIFKKLQEIEQGKKYIEIDIQDFRKWA